MIYNMKYMSIHLLLLRMYHNARDISILYTSAHAAGASLTLWTAPTDIPSAKLTPPKSPAFDPAIHGHHIPISTPHRQHNSQP